MEKISIIIPIKNLKEITQVCLDSIKNYTHNYELILIDDGSEEETKEFLINTEKNFLIRNDKSVGWPKAINQGSEIATGDYIIYLNNDVVVTPNWIEKMVAHFKMDNKLGILGCTTNRVEGHQHIDFNDEKVDFQYTDSLTGFCLMLRREVFDRLKQKDGFWMDERFGLGGQDDADISYRTRKLGYQIGIARDVFIYHYGSATFRKEFSNDVEYSKKYAQSRVKILRDKYNMNNITQENIISQSNNAELQKKLVMICIPTLGTIRTELISRLIQWSRSEKYRVVIYPTVNIQPLDAARNHCVKEFLEISNSPDDVLIFNDDDIIPPMDGMERLINHNKDMVGGTCFVMKATDGEYFPYPVALRYNEDKKFIVYYGKGLEEIDTTGGGFVAIKRKVFESFDEAPYKYKYYHDGTLELVADFNFFARAKEKGFELWYDFDLVCDHIKNVSLLGINDLLLKVKTAGVNNG